MTTVEIPEPRLLFSKGDLSQAAAACLWLLHWLLKGGRSLLPLLVWPGPFWAVLGSHIRARESLLGVSSAFAEAHPSAQPPPGCVPVNTNTKNSPQPRFLCAKALPGQLPWQLFFILFERFSRVHAMCTCAGTHVP